MRVTTTLIPCAPPWKRRCIEFHPGGVASTCGSRVEGHVQFAWGSLDLALVRFSDRRATGALRGRARPGRLGLPRAVVPGVDELRAVAAWRHGRSLLRPSVRAVTRIGYVSEGSYEILHGDAVADFTAFLAGDTV
jgi:hypothetical protein